MYRLLKKAENIQEAVNVFEPGPLKVEELKDFYIQTDDVRDEISPTVDEIKLHLRNERPCKILFAGHRGSGKSTELVRLQSQIEDEFYIIKFSVSDHLDLYNLEYSDLILLLIERIFKQASDDGYIRNEKLIQTIYDWFSIITKIETKSTDSTARAEAGVGTPSILDKLLCVMARLTAEIKFSSGNKVEIQKNIKQRISQLKTNCDVIINEIQQNLSNRKLLVIIEDLDKVELPRLNELFYKHSGILSEINTRIIYTVPIFLLNSQYRNMLQNRFCIVTLPMIKINQINGKHYESGRNRLKEIVYSRIEKNLLKYELLDNVIGKTGGVIRDLFKVLEVASTASLFNKKSEMEEKYLLYGLNRVKNDYNSSIVGEKELKITTQDLYDELKRIYNSGKKTLPYDDNLAVLLNSQALVEYNGEKWFDIHPLVVDLMKDLGYIENEKSRR